MLLGQGGMLDFGHAVFLGLGGFLAMHALRLADAGWWVPAACASRSWSALLGGLVAAILPPGGSVDAPGRDGVRHDHAGCGGAGSRRRPAAA